MPTFAVHLEAGDVMNVHAPSDAEARQHVDRLRRELQEAVARLRTTRPEATAEQRAASEREAKALEARAQRLQGLATVTLVKP